jgi:hypothetical protein
MPHELLGLDFSLVVMSLNDVAFAMDNSSVTLVAAVCLDTFPPFSSVVN